jgi:signal peptidase II
LIVDFLKNLNKKKFLLISFIIAFCVSLDQISKYWANEIITEHNNLVRINQFLNIIIVENNGISFGMFQNFKYSNLFFIFTTVVIMFFLFKILLCEKCEKKYLNICCICMIISGAIGNLIDRIKYGAVRDFIDLHLTDFHWPTFNIADSMISIGVLIYIFIQFRKDISNAEIN